MSTLISVVIVEDDPVTRAGMNGVLSVSDELNVVGAYSTVEAMFADELDSPDVLLLDLRLRRGKMQGPDAIRELVRRGYAILVVSVSEDEGPVLNAIGAGASGYLTKEAEPDEIVRAVKTVAAGRTYFSPTVAGYLLKKRIALTPREEDILRLVAAGERTADIAVALGIAEATVNGHLDRIRDKTGYRRRADLTRLAFERGLVAPDTDDNIHQGDD